MIRCHDEVIDRTQDKKTIERRERPFVALRRLDFESLLRRDGARWGWCQTPEQLARVAERVRKEIVPEEFGRFVSHLCAAHGVGFVRAAGLPIGRIQLAS